LVFPSNLKSFKHFRQIEEKGQEKNQTKMTEEKGRAKKKRRKNLQLHRYFGKKKSLLTIPFKIWL
jgi:hypothetical protein